MTNLNNTANAKKEEKTFAKYNMVFNPETMQIESVKNADGKETQFTNTFYESNIDYLNTFSNIKLFVKPKKELVKKHAIKIDLEDFEAQYTDTSEDLTEEDLKLAMKIIKNMLGVANPKIKELKEKLYSNQKNLKIMEEMSEDMDLTDQIAQCKENIEKIKEEIEKLMSE